ncbi:hypothetical protein AAGS40_23400 [Paraburkholderia sp. PREW-6R]|uniref:hypothetical protein n=1 Tax=Paraburkholderia sp. PREW-6R TaxID=3141544 RepID=UPI0031F505A6
MIVTDYLFQNEQVKAKIFYVGKGRFAGWFVEVNGDLFGGPFPNAYEAASATSMGLLSQAKFDTSSLGIPPLLDKWKTLRN